MINFISLVACAFIFGGNKILVHSAPSKTSSIAIDAPTLLTSSTTPSSTIIDEQQPQNKYKERISTIFNKFETRGPTLTLTLRDPTSATLLSGGAKASSKGKLWPSKRSKEATPKKVDDESQQEDDGTFGLSSKLAALFHITPTTSTNGQTISSSRSNQFSDGYMLDDGEIYLDPPITSTGNDDDVPSATTSSSSRGLFSIREMGNSILGNRKAALWTGYAQSIHPEISFEMKSRETSTQSTATITSSNDTDSDANGENSAIAGDTRPFPETAPWLSAITCGMVWSPFPVYKNTGGYTTSEDEGYGHKLLSIPHYIRCGAKISLPRVSYMIRQSTFGRLKSTADALLVEQQAKPAPRELNLGVTYQENPYQYNSGKVEVLLGRFRSSLPPAAKISTMKKSLLSSSPDDQNKYRRNNHLLVRLATNGSNKATSNSNSNSLLSSIEYTRGSFRMPTPSFMRSKAGLPGYKEVRVLRGKGVSVSPSYDFIKGIARCVVSGDVGSSGRTRAVLRLDVADDCTLTIVRALDER